MPFMRRYVASELVSDIIVSIGGTKFYLHKVCSDPSTMPNKFNSNFCKVTIDRYNSFFMFISLTPH